MRTEAKRLGLGLIAILCVTVWSVMGGGCADSGSDSSEGCIVDTDCASGQTCLKGICVIEEVTRCETDEDCEEDQRCTAGFCKDSSPLPDGDSDEDSDMGNPDEDGDLVPTDGDLEDVDTEDGDLEPDEEDEQELEPGRHLQVEPMELNFLPQPPGGSESITVTMRNIGTEPVSIGLVRLTHDSSPDFDVEEISTLTLLSGQSRSFPVDYLQSDDNEDSGTLEINHNADTLKTLVPIRIHSVGVPNLHCEPSRVDFGYVSLNDGSATRSVTCENKRLSEEDHNLVLISGFDVQPEDGKFRLGQGAPPNLVSLRTGDMVTVPVVFFADDENPQTGSFLVYHNALDPEESPITIYLEGQGVRPTLIFEPSSVVFDSVLIGSFEDQEISLVAPGANVQVNEIRLNTESDEAFELDLRGQLDDGPVTLGFGDRLYFNLRFTPTQTTEVLGTLEVLSPTLEEPKELNLRATGKKVEFNTVPSEVNFGMVPVGSCTESTLTLKNDGSEDIQITEIELANENDGVVILSGPSPTYRLRTQEIRTYELQFCPLVERMFTNSFRIRTDRHEFPEVDVLIQGQGVLPHLELDPDNVEVNLGDVVITKVKEAQVLVTNTGGMTLELSDLAWLDSSPGWFTYSAVGVTQLDLDESLALVFRIQPPQDAPPGSYQKRFRFLSNDGTHETVTLTVKAQVINPYVGVEPSDTVINLGSYLPGQSAEPFTIRVFNQGTGLLQVENIFKSASSSGDFVLEGLPESFPVMLSDGRADPPAGSLEDIEFVVHFTPGSIGPKNAEIRVVNEGWVDGEYSIFLRGWGDTCQDGTHECGGECVGDHEVIHCGDRCEPCPVPDHSIAVCTLENDNYHCGFTCQPHYNAIGNECFPVNEVDCCGHECNDCTFLAPEHSTPHCSDQGVCAYTCNNYFHEVGDLCLANDTADCCGLYCNQCPDVDHAESYCDDGYCDYRCVGAYKDCNGVDLDGCEVNTDDSVINCGQCSRECNITNADTACVFGVCQIDRAGCQNPEDPTCGCEEGWADCNGLLVDGCEVDLRFDEDNCGVCGLVCDLPHTSVSRCNGGSCEPWICAGDYKDCNDLPEDGCEIDSANNPHYCGSCLNNCNLPNADSTCEAGQCIPTTCAPGYGDCDGQNWNGCEQELNVSALHCGACNTDCQFDNAVASCNETTYTCDIQQCLNGYMNCNGDPSDGCETNGHDIYNCGGCNISCVVPNAVSACNVTSCSLVSCEEGFGNCDGIRTNGCEINTDTNPDYCGNCLTDCNVPHAAQQGCEDGICQALACNEPYGDCDGNGPNGCETDLTGSVDHCGACGHACNYPNATATCVDGECQLSACDDGYGDCDGISNNGCETRLDTANNCGSCALACPDQVDHGTASCLDGRCQSTSCETGYMDCNEDGRDGCEVYVDGSDVNNCGYCGQGCEDPPSNGVGICQNGSCGLYCDDTYWPINGQCTRNIRVIGSWDNQDMDVVLLLESEELDAECGGLSDTYCAWGAYGETWTTDGLGTQTVLHNGGPANSRFAVHVVAAGGNSNPTDVDLDVYTDGEFVGTYTCTGVTPNVWPPWYNCCTFSFTVRDPYFTADGWMPTCMRYQDY